jgi:hypothetical protein
MNYYKTKMRNDKSKPFTRLIKWFRGLFHELTRIEYEKQ